MVGSLRNISTNVLKMIVRWLIVEIPFFHTTGDFRGVLHLRQGIPERTLFYFQTKRYLLYFVH